MLIENEQWRISPVAPYLILPWQQHLSSWAAAAAKVCIPFSILEKEGEERRKYDQHLCEKSLYILMYICFMLFSHILCCVLHVHVNM